MLNIGQTKRDLEEVISRGFLRGSQAREIGRFIKEGKLEQLSIQVQSNLVLLKRTQDFARRKRLDVF